MEPDVPDYPTLTDAVCLGTAGMRAALAHANNAEVDWGDLAYAFLIRFARAHQSFVSEDVSLASKLWGMVQPPTDRAWGSIYRKAARRGFIRQCGLGRSRRRHGSICPRWESLLYRPPA